jgi:putative ABC transport system permease protein
MSRADRFFKRLLRLFPADFRGDFGDDMAETFSDQRRDVLARGDGMDALRLWWDTIRGILTTAPREHLDLLRSDVRYALRNLRRHPGFTVVAVLALAVGIGANTAVFTIVNGVLLRALPYERPDELVTIFEKAAGAPVDHFDVSAPDYAIVKELSRSFSGMFIYANRGMELSGVSESQTIVGTRVSPEIFDVLGARPILGRGITAEDDRGNAKIAVLTYGLWSRLFGRDASAIGRTIALDRQPYTIVGVMGDSFEFPPRGGTGFSAEPGAVYVPIAFTPQQRAGFGSQYNNGVVARLRPGVTIDRARAELSIVTRTLAERYPPMLTGLASQLTLPMSPFLEDVVGQSRRMILLLMAAVAIVLLIGCADVANLMLTRASSRQREIAVRSALGASPARVVRQLLTESLVLSSMGGALGLLLAWWTMRAMIALAGETLPRVEAVSFDRRIVLFTVALSFLTPLLFGVVPALRTALRSSFDALKEGGRSTAGHGRQSTLNALIVAQFALALMLSVGAGLLLRSFSRLLATNPGFKAEHVVTASVRLPATQYRPPQIAAFHQRTVDAVRQIPGVAAAATATDRPLKTIERRTYTADATATPVDSNSRVIAATWIAGSYFDAMSIPLRRGRVFVDADGQQGGRVVILSEMLARRLWPDQDPIERQFKWGIDVPQNRNPWMTIVGVVADVNQSALGVEPIAQTYEPIWQQTFDRRVNIIARSDRDPSAILTAIRGAMQQIDPALPLSDAQPVADVVADSVKPQRFSVTVVGLFAIVALALAAIGVYGVLANAVAQQTHEIGVRMALGAQAATVMWSVLRRALLLMSIGAVIGTAGALALTRLMASLLYGVRPTDAATYASSTVLLAILAVGASLVPAWRATRVDPLVALRAD